MEDDHYCPILKRTINDAYCYEINNVAYRIIKPEAIEDKIDRAEAEKICDSCKNNQMR